MSNNHRKAVIVVHGMGNQIPLTSIREFVENVNSGGSQLYSSPDRIVGDLETRRFSYHNRSHDYYELYWAHLVEEPSMFEVVSWSLKLLLCKKPSARAFTAVICVRIIITVLMILMGYLAFNFEDFMGFFQSSHGIVASGVLVFIVYKLLYPALKTMFSTALLQSIGDVVKYTVPSPKNINVRNKIRQKGLEMLKKLHEAKDTSGDYIYDDIVVVGHSLGSIVCYDLLTFLFPEYNTSSIVKSKYDQDNIKAFAELVSNNPDLSSQEYQLEQRKVVMNYRKFELKWRVSDFITLGSPLTHASMVMANNENELRRRQEIREFPTCPPVSDKIDSYKYFYEQGSEKFLVPHHAALFALTRWTNIYFKNDLIGGPLSPLFGNGIVDHELTSESSFWNRIIPFRSHSSYWAKKEKESLDILNKAI